MAFTKLLFEDEARAKVFAGATARADEAGLEGFALFRPNRLRGEVLSAGCDRPPGGRA